MRAISQQKLLQCLFYIVKHMHELITFRDSNRLCNIKQLTIHFEKKTSKQKKTLCTLHVKVGCFAATASQCEAINGKQFPSTKVFFYCTIFSLHTLNIYDVFYHNFFGVIPLLHSTLKIFNLKYSANAHET